MLTVIGIVTTVLLALRMRKFMSSGHPEDTVVKETANGAKAVDRYWDFVAKQYLVPLGQTFISYCYGLYLRFSILNTVIFIVKYVPTAVFMYKFMKKMYVSSKERIKQKQMELEDIQLQIQIVNTKLCVRDAEFSDRAQQLRRGAERLRLVRTRVRDLIATDDTLRRALDNATLTLSTDTDCLRNATPDQDSEFSERAVQLQRGVERLRFVRTRGRNLIAADDTMRRALDNATRHALLGSYQEFLLEILKDLKLDHNLVSDKPEFMDCGEHPTSEPVSESVYSSLSDADKDCHVKIVRVTNVYKVACLKHYIKQKKLRRASRQAVLKKKIENIKKLLEDWQKSLNMVINSKLNVLNGCMDARNEDTSQEAMGDYSKPTLRESSNSDSDLRNSNDLAYDDYWAQNGPYQNYPYEYEDLPDSHFSREYCDTQEFCQLEPYQQYEGSKKPDKLSTLLEETKSQILFEDKSNEDDDSTCHDLIQL